MCGRVYGTVIWVTRINEKELTKKQKPAAEFLQLPVFTAKTGYFQLRFNNCFAAAFALVVFI